MKVEESWHHGGRWGVLLTWGAPFCLLINERGALGYDHPPVMSETLERRRTEVGLCKPEGKKSQVGV